jgi:hypothetical protein
MEEAESMAPVQIGWMRSELKQANGVELLFLV